MMYIRGNPSDFEDWKKLGNPGWGYDDVLPLFKKSEDNQQFDVMDGKYHSKGGLLPVSKFPYAPPMSYAFLKGGEELGKATGSKNID